MSETDETQFQFCPSCGFPAHAGHAPDCDSLKKESTIPIRKGDLRDYLGEDWEKRAFSDNLSVDEKRALLVHTSEEDSRILANSKGISSEAYVNFVQTKFVLESNAPNVEVSLVEIGGKIQMLTKSNIGGDIFYSFTDPDLVVRGSRISEDDVKLKSTVVSDKLGLFDPKTEQVFSLDAISDPKDRQIMILFHEIEGMRHHANSQITELKTSGSHFTTLTNFPLNVEELEVLLHEIGHLLLNKRYISDGIYERKGADYDKAFGRKPANADELKAARQTVVGEERAAHAVAYSFLRKLNHAGFSVGSSENLKKIRDRTESALLTYDGIDFIPHDHIEQRAIPTQFSDQLRRETRKLISYLKKKNLGVNEIPNFDTDSGEPIGNNPKRQREILEKNFGK